MKYKWIYWTYRNFIYTFNEKLKKSVSWIFTNMHLDLQIVMWVWILSGRGKLSRKMCTYLHRYKIRALVSIFLWKVRLLEDLCALSEYSLKLKNFESHWKWKAYSYFLYSHARRYYTENLEENSVFRKISLYWSNE